MYFHIVWKHIKCLPCNILIDVRKFSMTQGAIPPRIRRCRITTSRAASRTHQPCLGFYICPKCKRRASIVDPPAPKPEPPPEIDKADAKVQYDVLLTMKSVAERSVGEYPDFEAFCDYLRKHHVQIDYQERTIKRILIAGDNFKLDYFRCFRLSELTTEENQ